MSQLLEVLQEPTDCLICRMRRTMAKHAESVDEIKYGIFVLGLCALCMGIGFMWGAR